MIHKRFAAGAALVSIACFAELPEAKLDRGGLTFDFEAVSQRRFHIPLPGDAEYEAANAAETVDSKGEL